MSTFEFVTVLMSIVVGLGIARLLSGFAALIEVRKTVRMDWVTILWAINVLGYHTLFWWIVVNNWRSLEEWSFTEFGALFVYGIFVFFCASLILPRRVKENLDMQARFESIRQPFYGLWFCVLAAEFSDSFLKGSDYVLNELGLPYFALVSTLAAVNLGGLLIADRRYHYGAAIAFFALHAIWMMSSFWTI